MTGASIRRRASRFCALVVAATAALPLAATPALAASTYAYGVSETAAAGTWAGEGILALPTSVTGNGNDAVSGWIMATDDQGDWIQVGWIENPDGPTQWFSEAVRGFDFSTGCTRSGQCAPGPVGSDWADTYAPMSSATGVAGDSVNVWMQYSSGSWQTYVYDGAWQLLSSTALPFGAAGADWQGWIEASTFGTEAAPTDTFDTTTPVSLGLFGE